MEEFADLGAEFVFFGGAGESVDTDSEESQSGGKRVVELGIVFDDVTG